MAQSHKAQYPIDSDFIMRESSAPSKGGLGKYCRIAILEVDQGRTYASSITTRAPGVRSVVQDSGRVHNGSTAKSEAGQVRARFDAECNRLNKSQAARRKRAATRAAKAAALESDYSAGVELAT